MGFQTTLKLNDNLVLCNELTVRQYRNLLKCFVGNEIDSKLVYINVKNILLKLTDLTSEQIEQLSYLEFLILLINIRIVSMGSVVSLIVNENNTQLKIDVNLNKTLETLYKILSSIKLTSINLENYKIELCLPSVIDIFEFETTNSYLLPVFFIKCITVNNEEVPFKSFSYKDREIILQSFPTKTILYLNNVIQDIINNLNTTNILESIAGNSFQKILPVTINSEIIFFIIKLLYNTNIESLYEMLFILSKGANLSGEFLDNCTPGEFYLFFKKFEELSAKQQQEGNTQNNFYPDELPNISSNESFDLTE